MTLQFLGTGTSQGIPVIACSCEVCRSDDIRDKRLRCSVLIREGDTQIVIDCGPDFRQQMLRARVEQLDAILITHEHNDHIMGLDDVRPFNFKQHCSMPLYAQQRVLDTLKRRFAYAFEENPYPGAPSYALHAIGEEPFEIGAFRIQPFTVLHGEMPVTAFRMNKLAYITDMKTITAEEQKKLQGVEVLVLNALHRRPHHSHLNLEEALAFAKSIGAARTFLIHMSHRMGLHSALERELEAYSAQQGLSIRVAYDGLKVEVG